MGRAESGIQSYVLERLALLERRGLCYSFRNNSFTGRVMRYDGSQGYIKNAKRGMPDIVCCIAGRFIGIEVKSAIGRQSPEQKIAQQHIEKVGGLYWLIRTPEELEKKLKEIGIS